MDPTRKSPSWAVTQYLIGLFLVSWLVLAAQLLFVVPAYEKTFEDFRMRLPFVTEITILLARIAVRYWILLVPGVLAAVVLGCWVSYLVRHQSGKRWLSVLWFLLLIGVPIVANAMLWTALWLPMRQLQEGLRK